MKQKGQGKKGFSCKPGIKKTFEYLGGGAPYIGGAITGGLS